MAGVSLKDIAKRVGVSNATVSLVLNGKAKEGRISKEVAEMVFQVAREVNYRPNMLARSLRTGKSKTLGLIVADISNPFFAKLARYIENIAAKEGYQVMFGSSDESSEKFKKLINLFLEKNVDGILVAPPQNSEAAIMELVRRRVPTVLVDRGVEGVPVSSIQIDNVGASFALTNFLVDKGCRRIAFIAYNIGLSNIQKRYDGYKKSLMLNNISLDESIVWSVTYENFEENIEQGIKELMKIGIDSIVFATNRVGVQSLIALQKYEGHKELKYVSIDNSDEYKLCNLSIKCIEQPLEGIGRRALDILFKHIEDPTYDDVEQVTLQAKIID